MMNDEELSLSVSDVATTHIALPAHIEYTGKKNIIEDEIELEHIWKHSSLEAMKGSTRQILPRDVHSNYCHTEIDHCSSGLPGNARTTMTETYVGDHVLYVLNELER